MAQTNHSNNHILNLRMGVASVVITPRNHIGLPLGGYGGRTDFCKGIHDDLFARINYFSWDNADSNDNSKKIHNQFLLISLDLVAINSKVSDFFLYKIEKMFGIPFDQIIVSCTHTHSGWESLGMLAPGKLGFTGMITSRLNTKVHVEVWKKIFQGIADAKINTQEVLVGYDKISIPENYTVIRRKPPAFTSQPMGIIKISDKSGKLVSLICGFGAHGTIVKPSNVYLSAEWMGAFVRHLGDYYLQEKQSHQNEAISNKFKYPNAVFINFFLEAEGDIAPFCFLPDYFKSDPLGKNNNESKNQKEQVLNDRKTIKAIRKQMKYLKSIGSPFLPKNDWDLMDNYGKSLAQLVFSHVNKIQVTMINTIHFVIERFTIPLYGKAKSSELKDVIFYIKDRIQKGILFHLFKLLHSTIFSFVNYGRSGLKYFVKGRIVGIRINDLILLSSPGETFHTIAKAVYDYGKHVNNEVRPMIQIIGFGNDYMSYLYPLEEFYKGGYENDFQLAPQAGMYVLKGLKKVVLKLI